MVHEKLYKLEKKKISMYSPTNNTLWIIGSCTLRMGRCVRQAFIEHTMGKVKWWDGGNEHVLVR